MVHSELCYVLVWFLCVCCIVLNNILITRALRTILAHNCSYLASVVQEEDFTALAVLAVKYATHTSLPSSLSPSLLRVFSPSLSHALHSPVPSLLASFPHFPSIPWLLFHRLYHSLAPLPSCASTIPLNGKHT